MNFRASHFVLASFVLFTCVRCTDAPEAPDVMSELPGEVRYRTFGSAAEVPTVEILTPANFFTKLNTGATTPVEVTYSANVCTDVTGGTYKIAWYDNSETPVATQATCDPITFNLAYGDHQLTVALLDASDQELTNATSRSSVRVRITKQCSEAGDVAECKDSFFCSSTACIPQPDGTKLCKFGAPPYAKCCQQKLECTFGEYCDATEHKCVACLSDSHCDDQNLCTTDTCSGGKCTHVKEDPNCCDCSVVATSSIDIQCADGKFCTKKGCDCAANKCTLTTKVFTQGKCCETGAHASCDDSDACNVDFCISNICRHGPPLTAVPDCCNGDADCKDGNVCTTDTCDIPNNTCEFKKVNDPDCCNSKADCDDKDAKTIDSCVTFKCVHTPDPDWCEIPAQSTVVINEIMANPAAITDADGEWIELYNVSSAAVDIDGWTITNAIGSKTVTLGSGSPLLVPAGGYFVLCRNGDKAQNGGVVCGYAYGNAYTIGNDIDEIILKDKSGTKHDEVAYDGGTNFPETPQGASLALKNPEKDNNVGENFAVSTVAISATNTDKGTPGAKNTDIFALFEVASCKEKPADNICTTDTCVANKCTHVKKAGCCVVVGDCQKPTACHSAECKDNLCEFTQIPAPTCCLTDSVCKDEKFCNVDKCIGNKCRYGPDITKVGTNCCDEDADCGSLDNKCVTNECDTVNNECKPPLVVTKDGCCSKNTHPLPALPGECDDGNPATVDSCKDFLCVSLDDPQYCDTQPGGIGTNNCALDNDVCTDESCNTTTKKCNFTKTPGCCKVTSDCDDADPCTKDACDTNTNKCVNTKTTKCCLASKAATQCDDSNKCTKDECIGLALLSDGTDSIGTCRNVKTDLTCCIAQADCNDKDACTTDSCDLAGNKCIYTPVVLADGKKCCDPLNQKKIIDECNDGNLCTLEKCVDNVCGYDDVPPNSFGKCCDLTNAGGVSEEDLCDDVNPCTLDKCIFGRCRNLDAGTSSCCNAEKDCPDDGNTCTKEFCDVPTHTCDFVLAEPCTAKLNWTETWTNVGPKGITQKGWAYWENPLATNASKANWQHTTKGALGPDEHMRFYFAPSVADYNSCIFTPKLDSTTFDGPQVFKVKEFMTMQFEHSIDVNASDAKLSVFAWQHGEGLTGPLEDYGKIGVDNNWKLVFTKKLQAADHAEKLESKDMTGPPHYNTTITRYAFCIEGTASTKIKEWVIDTVRVGYGLAPYFGGGGLGQPPTEVTAVLGKKKKVLITASEKDIQTDPFVKFLKFTLVKAPSHITFEQSTAEFVNTPPAKTRRCVLKGTFGRTRLPGVSPAWVNLWLM